MAKTKEEILKRINELETVILKIQAENKRLKKMIADLKDLIGDDNFDMIMNLQGYSLKK